MFLVAAWIIAYLILNDRRIIRLFGFRIEDGFRWGHGTRRRKCPRMDAWPHPLVVPSRCSDGAAVSGFSMTGSGGHWSRRCNFYGVRWLVGRPFALLIGRWRLQSFWLRFFPVISPSGLKIPQRRTKWKGWGNAQSIHREADRGTYHGRTNSAGDDRASKTATALRRRRKIYIVGEDENENVSTHKRTEEKRARESKEQKTGYKRMNAINRYDGLNVISGARVRRR